MAATPVKYPPVMVYAKDWNQYSEQHRPLKEDYEVANGWLVGFLIDETDEHIVLAHTVFDSGDVRYAVVIPKCTIIQRNEFKLEEKS